MSFKILFVVFLCAAAASANRCCRGFKIFQFRRPHIMPIYEPPSCEDVFDDEDQYCDNSHLTMCPSEPVEKYNSPVNSFMPSYMDPKPHKCVCGKSMPPQRLMPNVPQFYKRGYCNSGMLDAISYRSGPSCRQYACGQYNECGERCGGDCCRYGGECQQQYGHCRMPQPVFRQPPHRVLPLTLPASCVC